MAQDTIPSRLIARAQSDSELPAYAYYEGGAWRTRTWGNYGDEVRACAKALIASGFEPGERVVIMGFNRPEWSIMDLGAMSAGGAPAGIYTTCPANEVQYIAHHCEAKLALVEDETQWQKFFAARENLPHLKKIVLMRGVARDASKNDELTVSWEDFIASGASVDDAEFMARVEALKLEQMATLIYTSGTTGPPKGVMLSHENLAWTAKSARQIVASQTDDRSLSYLPLSHIAEQMFTLHLPITAGGCVYYARSIETIKEDLQACKPTVFFGVPRIWEKFYAAFQAKASETKGLKKKIAAWAKSVGAQVASLRNRGQAPSGLLALKYKVARKLVFSKVRAAIGFDDLRIAVSGAAPISAEILEYFAALDLVVHEVYGQSEDSGPTSFNVPGGTLFGSVGPAFPGVDIRIADDDEILVRGKNVFMGYFKDDEATAAALQDGWLHSGDLGRIDDDGFLHIIGRKKDIIITAGGKNITPKNIESSLKNLDMVGEAVVVGDRRKYLVALISLDPDALSAYADKHGIAVDAVADHPLLVNAIEEGVATVNRELHNVEQIKRFRILPRPLSIEAGELTPTLKVKRNRVSEIWADLIDEVYEEKLAS